MSDLTPYFTDLQMREGLPPITAEDIQAVQAVIDQLYANKRVAEDHRKTNETNLERQLDYQAQLVAARTRIQGLISELEVAHDGLNTWKTEAERLGKILDRNPLMVEGKHMGGSDVCVTCAAHCVTAIDDQFEIERLRKIAAKYELLSADGDQCAELVATAYDEWDTDIPWFRQLDCAVAECQQGKKP